MRRTIIALKAALEDADVPHDDKIALCIVTECVLVAGCSTLLAMAFATLESGDDGNDSMPPVD